MSNSILKFVEFGVQFKAYGSNGRLLLISWTGSLAAETAERDVFKVRLDRGEFLYVEISHYDGRAVEVLRPSSVLSES
jgi:hypothetical protein